ncbi:PLP-dependent transferase [Nocardia abscessus]|nr:PLP-dependent transferase [Nocardia abscessus]
MQCSWVSSRFLSGGSRSGWIHLNDDAARPDVTSSSIDRQGSVLGGGILGARDFTDGPVKTLMRHTGPALSAFNAWTLLEGLGNMPLRARHSVQSARAIAERHRHLQQEFPSSRAGGVPDRWVK